MKSVESDYDLVRHFLEEIVFSWITAEILDLCDKRRELRKKRFEPEGVAKYKEVNNNIKRIMKKAKENWIGEQCSEIEENLRKNKSKRGHTNW